MSKNILISIKPQYADKILSCEKMIELRKSSLGLKAGDMVWVYTTSPKTEISFCFDVYAIKNTLCKYSLWVNFEECLGISKEEYLEYFKNCEGNPWAIIIGDIKRLTKPVKRSECPPFHPPQSVLNLDKNKELLEFLLKKL